MESLTGDAYTLSIAGCMHAGRTGQTLAFSKALSAIAIAEPSYNISTPFFESNGTADLTKSVLDQRGLRAGRVVVVSLPALFHSGVKAWRMCDISGNRSLSVTLSGRDMEGRFGISMAFYPCSGDRTEPKGSEFPTHETLVIGSPLSRDGTGAIFGYAIKVNEAMGRLNSKAIFIVQGDKFDGEKKSRFGSALIAAPGNNSESSGRTSFLAAAPLADLGFPAPDNDQRGRLFLVDIDEAEL